MQRLAGLGLVGLEAEVPLGAEPYEVAVHLRHGEVAQAHRAGEQQGHEEAVAGEPMLLRREDGDPGQPLQFRQGDSQHLRRGKVRPARHP